MRTEDGFIIRRCLDDEPEAFGLLVDKYKASIYALVYTKLRNSHDAEDVTQEVFIKAYKNLRTLRRWDSFLSWLYSIASNLCSKWLRSQSKRPDSEFIEDQDPDKLEIPSLDSYRNDEVYKLVHDALNSLPEIYRQVLTLYYLGGMNSEEIARFLGISPTNIRQRLSRARMQLREDVLSLMSMTLEQQRLQASFTFRIVEMVKRIKINPMPNTTALPWGLSLTAGIIFTIMCFTQNLNHSNPVGTPVYSPLPAETKVLKVGELPVDVLRISNMPFLSSQQGTGKGGEPQKPIPQYKSFSQIGVGRWVKKGDMPTGRSILSTGVVGGKIYVFGGVDQERTLTTVEEYDPVTGEWIKKADMPNIRYSLSVSEVNGKIYVIGGWRSEDDLNLSMVEEYNPKTNKWIRKADMLTPRSALSTSVVNGKIYAIGGDGGNYLPAPTLSVVEEYDPATDTWTKKADMPTPRGSLCTAVVNGKIYAIGGITGIAGGGGPLVSIVEEYDPVTNTWTQKSAKMPTPRSLFSVSVVNGKIYAIGGDRRNINVNNIVNPYGTSLVEEYDPVKDVWTKKVNMPTKRCCLSTAAVKGKIYAIGGTDELPFGKGFTTVEEYTPE